MNFLIAQPRHEPVELMKLPKVTEENILLTPDAFGHARVIVFVHLVHIVPDAVLQITHVSEA